jgi:hypothetical protein
MKRAWLWMALATTASAVWGCGYSCPNGNPVGLYGCVVTCADLPADAGYVCVRPGDERTFDDATGDRSIADGSADTSDTATTTDAADVTAMDQADVGAIEGGEAGTSADAGDASDVSDVTTDGPTVIVDPMLDAPRAVAPSSTSTVTTQRPTLRWSNGATIDGAVVEVSRTRDFATVLHRLSSTGDRARIPSALSAGVWFWRLRGRDSARNAEGTATSPIWWFRVGARSADGDRDRSWGSELDLNGDGYADVAVGSPGSNGGRGRVDVYYGGPTGIGTVPSVTLRGVAAGDSFGNAVASAGDVNGDGFGDLVVGAYLADPGGRMTAGSASVFHGSAAGVVIAPARVLEGIAAGDFFGFSVAGAGDVNGDGFSDLVVGAYAAAPGGRMEAGSASVFHGSASGVAMAPARVLEGAVARDRFGWSVASAGDVNGDGFSDVIVGAYAAAPGGRTEAGSANVFHGSASGVVMAPARVLEGGAAGDRFGVSVASAGDVNSDGFGDLVVGAYFAAPGGRVDAGSASVFHGGASGVVMAPARVLEGGAAGDFFGLSVASAGDARGGAPAHTLPHHRMVDALASAAFEATSGSGAEPVAFASVTGVRPLATLVRRHVERCRTLLGSS